VVLLISGPGWCSGVVIDAISSPTMTPSCIAASSCDMMSSAPPSAAYDARAPR
jgi:hypothetical protein